MRVAEEEEHDETHTMEDRFEIDNSFRFSDDDEKSKFNKKMQQIKNKSDKKKRNVIDEQSGGGNIAQNEEFDEMFSDDEPMSKELISKAMVHRDTLKEKGQNSKGRFSKYELAGFSDSDDDDGELTDDDKKYKNHKMKIDDQKYLRGTEIMGGVINIDQTESIQTGK